MNAGGDGKAEEVCADGGDGFVVGERQMKLLRKHEGTVGGEERRARGQEVEEVT
jgi:hypothetical protein